MDAPIKLGDWQAEMEKRGKLDCRFVCPACGATASPNDFMALGADYQRASTECIGRVAPRKMAGGEFDPGPSGGCDWAAWGLFDICPVHLDVPGKDEPVAVFAFAEDT